MRVMVVARLFSGIADSLTAGSWQPKGVPAIYRLLEGLAARPDIELLTVFACKDPLDSRLAVGRRMTLEPIGDVVVLPWSPRALLALLGLDGKLREIDHLLRCLWLYARFRPDITYFTNANFLIAGLFARFGLGRVVLRFLGIHPEFRRKFPRRRTVGRRRRLTRLDACPSGRKDYPPCPGVSRSIGCHASEQVFYASGAARSHGVRPLGWIPARRPRAPPRPDHTVISPRTGSYFANGLGSAVL